VFLYMIGSHPYLASPATAPLRRKMPCHSLSSLIFSHHFAIHILACARLRALIDIPNISRKYKIQEGQSLDTGIQGFEVDIKREIQIDLK
jgi:hypothetical protein